MRRGRYLLIDNSNSFTKLALAAPDCLLQVRKVPTEEVSAASLRRAVQGWAFESIVLCSVVPEKRAVLEKALGPTPILTVSAAIDLGVGIDYPRPQTIGADRLANAAAAMALAKPPCVVVDFGTAVSFDIISRTGLYVGGVIAPGLAAMTDYLHQRTALLPRITLLEPPGAIGKSTRHAMLAGAVYGYRGLVKEILAQIRRELGGGTLRVLATGGYAELIAAGVPALKCVEDLTLTGLRLIGNRNTLPPRGEERLP